MRDLGRLRVVGMVLALLWGCGSAGDPCADVDCGGLGECVPESGVAICQCEAGLHQVGSLCLVPSAEPTLVQLVADEETLTQGGTVRFTLDVNGPAGVAEPVSAVIELAEGGGPVAEFELTAMPRRYRADLTWQAVAARREVSFLESLTLPLVVRLVREDGLGATVAWEVSLFCPGSGACNGVCDARMVVGKNVSLGPPRCCTWSCGQEVAVECLANPVAWLWMDDEARSRLVKDLEADVEVDGLFLFHDRCSEVGVEIHGGIARKFPKKSYKIKFNRGPWYPLDPFATADGGVPVPDDVGYKQLLFKAYWVDTSFLRDQLTHDLVRAAGGLSPRVTHCHLMLNGEYHGLYGLAEAVLEDWVVRQGLPAHGNLYKAVDNWANLKPKEDPTKGYEKKMNENASWEDLEQLIETISQTSPYFNSFSADVEPLIDLDLYLIYHAINAYAHNKDFAMKNYFLYRELTGGDAPFITVSWDCDATWGLYWDGTAYPAAGDGLWGMTNALVNKLTLIPEYKNEYKQILADGLDDLFAPEVLGPQVEERVDRLATDVEYDECLWERETTFAESVDWIRTFVQERPAYVEDLL